MAKSISRTLLAKPNFVAGINDKLAAIDVYTKNNRNIVNKIQDIAQLFDVDLSNILRGSKFIEDAFPVITNVTNNLIEINKENLVARIAGLSRSIGGSIRTLGSDFEDKLRSYEPLDQVYSKVGEIISQIRDVSYEKLSDISELVSNITGNTEFFTIEDKDAASAMFIGLIKEASANGIPDSFSSVISAIHDRDVLNNVINNVVPVAIDRSDVRMLKSIVESDDSNLVRMLGQDTIKKFTAKYVFGNGFGENQQVEEFRMLKETFDSINELWNRKIVFEMGSEVEIADATIITTASPDFQEGLINHIKTNENLDLNDKLLAVGTLYRQEDVDKALAHLFPFHVNNLESSNGSTPVNPQV